MQNFGASLRPRYADFAEQQIDRTQDALDRYGNWLGEQVRAWNPETDTISDLKDFLEEASDVLGAINEVARVGDSPERYGIVMADLPSAEIPKGIDTTWPVWALDRAGNVLVGDAADNETTIVELIRDQHPEIDDETPILASDLPEPVYSWYLDSETFGEDAGGYVFDHEQQERPTWDTILTEYGYKIWGIEP